MVLCLVMFQILLEKNGPFFAKIGLVDSVASRTKIGHLITKLRSSQTVKHLSTIYSIFLSLPRPGEKPAIQGMSIYSRQIIIVRARKKDEKEKRRKKKKKKDETKIKQLNWSKL